MHFVSIGIPMRSYKLTERRLHSQIVALFEEVEQCSRLFYELILIESMAYALLILEVLYYGILGDAKNIYPGTIGSKVKYLVLSVLQAINKADSIIYQKLPLIELIPYHTPAKRLMLNRIIPRRVSIFDVESRPIGILPEVIKLDNVLAGVIIYCL